MRCCTATGVLQAEGVAVAVLAGDVGRRGVVADERHFQLGRLRFLGQRVGGQRAAEHGAHLVLLHQLLHVLRGALRARLVEPHELGRLAHDRLVALLQRQERAVARGIRSGRRSGPVLASSRPILIGSAARATCGAANGATARPAAPSRVVRAPDEQVQYCESCFLLKLYFFACYDKCTERFILSIQARVRAARAAGPCRRSRRAAPPAPWASSCRA